MYKHFWQLFAKGYGRIPMAIFICGLALLTSLLEGFNIGLLVPLLESFQSSGQGQEHWISRGIADLFGAVGIPFGINSILLSLAVLISATAGLKYLRLIMVARLRAGFTAWIRSRYMWNLLNADLVYFHDARLGIMADNLSTQSNSAGGSVLEVIEMLANFTMLSAYLIAAFLVAPFLTAAAFVMLLIISASMQYFVAKGTAKGAILVQQDNQLQVSALESLGGIHVVKSFLLERFRWLDFSSTAESVSQTHYEISRDRSQMIVLQEISLFAMIGGIVYLGVSVLNLNIAVIVALLFVLYRLAPKVTSFNTMRHSLAESMAIVRAVSTAMDLPSRTTVVSGQTPFSKLSDGITLTDVSFSYGGSGEVLRGTSFSIDRGEMTAIVGASGAGKSTLIDLLMRYYDPSEGSITVDQVDLKELDLATWRKSIGIVSQDIFLFNDTVANNIVLGRPGVTEEHMIDAATQAYAHDFIMELPDGYQTRIGDRGWNLSGGQRQRISLARAIVERPGILILDEATSSLDSESEHLIQTYMTEIRGTCTMIVVAHRTATIRDADKIVVLQDGRIKEEGNWQTLVASSGVFATYQQLQSGDL